VFNKILVLTLVLSVLAVSGCFALNLKPISTTCTPFSSGDNWTAVIQSATTTLDYSNTTDSANYYCPTGSDYITIDDVHRTTSQDLVGITFAYVSQYATSDTIDAILGVYTNDPNDSSIEAIAYFDLYGLSTNGAYIYSINIDPLVTNSADLWIGVGFNDDHAGLVICGPPTIGSSHDMYIVQDMYDGNFYDAYPYFEGELPASFYLKTTSVPSVPEPGSMVALGSGLIGLLAFRRRRK
jgi:hypothetical protein